MGRVIAIDGPSGAGKSTVAKLLSEILGFDYLDTGALYRAVALGLLGAEIRPEADDTTIENALKKISVSFSAGKVFLGGRDVSADIRTPEVGHYSSVFSAMKPVRDCLLPVQREAAMRGDLVAEGRDMSTVVFPDAWKKFYIDASIDSRVKRRYLQLRKNGVLITTEEAHADVVDRDRRDSTRHHAPLRVGDDALYIDSSKLTLEEVMKKVLEHVRER